MLQLIMNGRHAGVYCSKMCELLCGMYGEYQLKRPSLRCVVDQNGRKSELSYIQRLGELPVSLKGNPPFPAVGMASGLKWE
jgi:hypothetical protein